MFLTIKVLKISEVIKFELNPQRITFYPTEMNPAEPNLEFGGIHSIGFGGV